MPSGVRKQLKLEGNDIVYRPEPNGRVYIELARAEERDPALGAFLALVEADIKAHLERLVAFDGALYDRLKALVEDVHVNLDEPRRPMTHHQPCFAR